MKLALRQRVPSVYSQALFSALMGDIERQGNLLAEGRLAGRHFTATSIPTTGDFAVGDIVWNSAPSDGGILGWVCTASGSPGTLKAFGFVGFDSEAKNTVLAGPSSGANAAPAFRALTIADIAVFGQLTASLAADVALNNTASYFDGPSIAQGTSGTWCVSGTVTMQDTAAAVFDVKLWDGTTVIASSRCNSTGAQSMTLSLSGYIASPSGNLRISAKDSTNTTGKIQANITSNSKDSTITAFRLA